MSELGVAQVSEKLYGRVTQYHAQIGHSVPKDTLCELEWRLLAEAKELFHRGLYEEALNTFTHCLAVTEKTRSSRDLAVRGAIVHNIASCLHHLGELEAAQEYYEQAIDSFNKAETPLIERLMYGNTNKRRIDFVKERLIDISWGRKPDVDKYLDENAKKQPVPLTPSTTEGATGSALSGQWAEDAPPPHWAQTQPSVGYELPIDRRPAWLDGAEPEQQPSLPPATAAAATVAATAATAAAAAVPNSCACTGGASAEATAHGDIDDETQERARREWLQYYQQIGDWAQAAELVVTQEEREDLEYLQERERRLNVEKANTPAARGPAFAHGPEDMYELNEAAASATRTRSATGKGVGESRSKYAPAAVSDDDDDDML